MKVVKNGMVDMPWDADGFIETKSAGFIAAVHKYGDVAVAFKDGKAYTHIDENGNCLDFASLVKIIKTAVRKNDDDYPEFYDDYAEIFDGVDFADGTVNFLDIGEYKEDIQARLEDLSGYWHIVESDMP